jgi:hypothetical protein
MTYRISPVWGPDSGWTLQKVGFDVELYAVADPASTSKGSPPSRHAALPCSYAAAREVAEWALGDGGQDVCIAIDAFDDRIVHRPRTSHWVVELVAHVLHCDDLRRPIDEMERRYVGGVKLRLATLGVPEG